MTRRAPFHNQKTRITSPHVSMSSATITGYELTHPEAPYLCISQMLGAASINTRGYGQPSRAAIGGVYSLDGLRHRLSPEGDFHACSRYDSAFGCKTSLSVCMGSAVHQTLHTGTQGPPSWVTDRSQSRRGTERVDAQEFEVATSSAESEFFQFTRWVSSSPLWIIS